MVDSPAYDASEEDNDPLTDDAKSSVSVPMSRLAGSHLRSSHSKHPVPSARVSSARHQLAHNNVLSDSDGVDGDIESTTVNPDTGPSHKISHNYHLYHHSTSSISTLGTPAATTVDPTMTGATPPDNSGPASRTQPMVLSEQVQEPPVPAKAKEAFNPAVLTAEDIQSFVSKAIRGEVHRKYKINSAPTNRPVRIYADGVYDLFHFGHALQLRQAKLSFPSVYLLVGVNSDEQVWHHKARTIMTHAERLEAVRHCRWVDEVVAEAPWVIDVAFIQKYEIDYVAHDEEHYASAGHSDVYNYVKSIGKFMPTRRTPGVSTSDLLERIVSGYRRCEFDDKLTKMGHSELRAEGSDYEGKSSRSETNGDTKR